MVNAVASLHKARFPHTYPHRTSVQIIQKMANEVRSEAEPASYPLDVTGRTDTKALLKVEGLGVISPKKITYVLKSSTVTDNLHHRFPGKTAR